MRTIFLADAHLASPDDDNYRLLLRFLHELEGELETLYIVGDLFDFWLGFPSHPFTEYDAVIDALERLVLRGCQLVYFEGNHDFHLGTVFSQRLNAVIHTGPSIESLQGKKLYVCHGDQINKADRLYRLLRFLLRTRLVAAGVRHFPPRWAQKVRGYLQKRSQASYGEKSARWDYRRIIFDFARSLQKKGYDGLVAGHFHLALCEELTAPPFAVISLGDWMEQFTYGEMRDGKLHLMTYSANQPIV
ncbi:MAG: UDP-2,3-diacylglucosamine diphosphatase [Desulfuromonadaceae bacterium]|nr:UDP-2,3-diacylglucosamine diphosphatase [Desulfuromonadaceae bacterium]MDD2847384.1 UDP-2,3-diacylglucosamine diphosphatase [Desulfuromonadaceae bacterium]MDD4131503.1 UDP-2,3-diacylglucosamine diphosphatase [Desulfuromonadaceae bacterium]